MTFTHDMKEYCAFCLEEVYGNRECDCEKTKLETKMGIEILRAKEVIKERYEIEYGVFWNEAKIQEFKDKNQKFYTSRDY